MNWTDTIFRPTTQVGLEDVTEDEYLASLFPWGGGIGGMSESERLMWISVLPYYRYMVTLFKHSYGFTSFAAKEAAAIAVKHEMVTIGLASLTVLAAIAATLLVFAIAGAAERQGWQGPPEQTTYIMRYNERLWLCDFIGMTAGEVPTFIQLGLLGDVLHVEKRSLNPLRPWEDFWIFGETMTRVYWWLGMWRFESIEQMSVDFIGLMTRSSMFVYYLQPYYWEYFYQWLERQGLI